MEPCRSPLSRPRSQPEDSVTRPPVSGQSAAQRYGRSSGSALDGFGSARFGPVRMVRAGGSAAGVGLVLGLLSSHWAPTIAAYTVVGAALAPVVPTVFSAAGNLPSGARALGWVVTISYVGGILGPAMIGFAARLSGLRASLGICVALAVVVAALAGRVATAQGVGSGAAAAPPHVG